MDIKSGDKNKRVTALQRGLIKIGYPLDRWGADGQVGAETLAAIAEYCEDKKLGCETDLDDGVVRSWVVESVLKEAEKLVVAAYPLIEDVRYDEYVKWNRKNNISKIDTICFPVTIDGALEGLGRVVDKL